MDLYRYLTIITLQSVLVVYLCKSEASIPSSPSSPRPTLHCCGSGPLPYHPHFTATDLDRFGMAPPLVSQAHADMARTFVGILTFTIWLGWTCLSQTPACLKNGVFDYVLPTEKVLRDLARGAQFTFAPGLLDAVQSKTPPTIAYFKALPLHVSKIWAIYLLVLEKSGHRPKIYIGCCAEKRSGVSTRMGQYRRGENLPRFVKRAIDDGYTITHKFLLCWVPIPPASKQFLLSAVMIALETTFSFYFWAMVSRTKNYGMPQLCPWPVDTLEYDGCCGHVALYEQIRGSIEEHLSAEEIDAVHSARKLKNSRRDRETRGAERHAQDQKKKREKALAEGRFVCNICNISFGANNQLEHHKTLPKHLNKAAGIVKVVKNLVAKERHNRNLAKKRFYCACCDYAAKTQQKLNNHLVTPKHLKQAASAKSSSKLD